jgi:DNA-binding response OmpR family regulator
MGTRPAEPPAGPPGATGRAGRPRPPATVLLAEHEPEVAELARRYLARAGLQVDVTTSPDETTAALAEHRAAVAVLDLTMPGLDARRVRRLLAAPPAPPGPLNPATPVAPPAALAPAPRSRAPHTGPGPAVFLIGPGMRPHDLRVSADACLTRPFSPRTLVARVLAVRPRPAPGAGAGAGPGRAVGPLTLDPGGRRVWSGDQEATLTPTEFTLLAALAGHPGRVLSRARLLAALGREPSGRAIDVYVAQLRAKLPGPAAIRTIRGVGYVLDAGNPGVPVQAPRSPR